jgi:hypothetical protein
MTLTSIISINSMKVTRVIGPNLMVLPLFWFGIRVLIIICSILFASNITRFIILSIMVPLVLLLFILFSLIHITLLAVVIHTFVSRVKNILLDIHLTLLRGSTLNKFYLGLRYHSWRCLGS